MDSWKVDINFTRKGKVFAMKLKALVNFVYTVTIIVFIAFGLITTYPVLSKKDNFRFLVVQSGSMEPKLKLGSVILVLPKKQEIISPVGFLPKFQKGEIISYLAGKETVTHRIVSLEKIDGKIFYQTKGDANQGADVEKIPEEKVLGKVAFSLPYLGYFISFAKTQMGFIALIIIPATIIVYSEILKIKEEIQKIVLKRKFSQP